MLELCSREDVKIVYSCVEAFIVYLFKSIYFAEVAKSLNAQAYDSMVVEKRGVIPFLQLSYQTVEERSYRKQDFIKTQVSLVMR